MNTIATGGRPSRRGPLMAKRAIDAIGAGAALVVLAIPMGIVALVVRRDVGRPVLFRQVRPGRDQVPFTIVKFRTMADGDGPDAERITRVGRVLRSTSLDELPELWNVLRGDMSLVGPRPLLSSYVARYSPRQARRHEVRPGITGLAQVQGRNTLAWPERLDLDVHYVDSWSVLGDLAILARTVLTVVSRAGVSAHGHATMPEFQGDADAQHTR